MWTSGVHRIARRGEPPWLVAGAHRPVRSTEKSLPRPLSDRPWQPALEKEPVVLKPRRDLRPLVRSALHEAAGAVEMLGIAHEPARIQA